MSSSPARSPIGVVGMVAALALVQGATACLAPADEESRTEVAARLITKASLEVFAPDRISNPVVSNEFLFDLETVGAFWHLDKMEVVAKAAPDSGVVLHVTGKNACFTADVNLETAGISAIEVEGEGLIGNSVIYWAAPGQPFSPDRKVTSEERNPGEPITFNVADHAQWSGLVGRIRIHPTSKPDHTLLVRAVRALRYRVDQARLEKSAHRSWQFTLGEETRPSRLALESEPFRWEVDARAGDRLEFAVGLQAGVRTPIQFRVWLSGEGLDPVSIWEREVNPVNGEADGWLTASIALPVNRPGRINLDFSVTEAEGFDPTVGLAAWGSPMIIRRRATNEGHREPNVLLISIDTLRPDHLSLYGYPRETSPNLDAWAASHAAVFDSVVASAPWTLPAHISMFSGLDAVRHGVNHGPRPGAVPLITEELAGAGLSTVAVTGGGFLDPRFGINAGFDSYRSHAGKPDGSRELEDGIDHLIAWLEDHRDRRFFAFFHTYEVHGPYRPRQPYFGTWNATDFDGVVDAPGTGFDAEDGYTAQHHLRLRTPGEPPRALDEDEVQLAIDCYDAGIAFTDAQLGRLFQFLQSSGLNDTTAVILTADHGESLGEKGLAGHAHLYDFNVLVPLLIGAPGRPWGGRRIAQQVRLIDVAPTILDLVGLPPPLPADGISLLPLLKGAQAAVPGEAWSYASKTNYGLALRVDGRVKYIYNNTAWPPAYGREELYLLDVDQGENTNVAGEEPIREELRERARRHLEENQRGIAVTIENRTNTALRGRLSTTATQKLIVTKIKAAGDTDQGVSVVDGRTVGFVVRPRSRLVVVTENIDADSLRVTGLAGDPMTGDLDVTLDLESDGEPPGVALRNGTWSALHGSRSPADAWIKAEWRHRGPPQSGTYGMDDPEVLRQLQALGYVDE